MKRLAFLTLLILPLLCAPAAADYGCWPFGGTDQLIFPSCTTASSHRMVDVNIVGGGAATPIPFPTFPWPVVFPSAQPVTATIAQPGTASVTSVASSTTSVQLLAANPSRVGYIMCNESTQIVYVAEGITATSSANGHSFALSGNSAVPYSCHEVHGVGVYTGAFNAIWASANGSMSITEEQ